MSKKVNKTKNIIIRVTEDEEKLISNLAAQLNISKSKLIRNLVLGNIDDVFNYVNMRYLPIFNDLLFIENPSLEEEVERLKKIEKLIYDIREKK
ncbi:DUF6290 family protein [Halarcobacter bivalviorum]|uniref:Ribbon-helix-helix protein CopG domain-containing protein n=1 Tax=Halarcobacter bivalviorum TaxID=663364 RepID=A0AAX2A9S7_9BACT|nr:DUF6290 family protein [Halarcobacter bivalviorum]AXH12393.1 hypothetical protein ABIV_1397 [Halarcobacter bivalviorum]RXK10680.1 hypothetical protein CRV05_05210 [Halarcobacter bivalviorum]